MKVLVTTDGSDASWTVAPHAAAFARASGGELILVRVLDPLIDAAAELDTDLDAAVTRVADAWKAELEAEAARRGIEARVLVHRLPRGVDVHDAICTVAGEAGAGLIAIHARGTGALRHALMGSVAMGVVGKGGVAVMVTGARATAPAGGSGYQVAVTTDGSAASVEIIPHIARVAAESPTIGIVLVRAYDDDEPAALAGLEALRAELPSTTNVEVRAVRKSGDTAAQIIETAREAGANAIAMATHGHGALRHLIAGSVALDVLGRSPLPVILARTH